MQRNSHRARGKRPSELSLTTTKSQCAFDYAHGPVCAPLLQFVVHFGVRNATKCNAR